MVVRIVSTAAHHEQETNLDGGHLCAGRWAGVHFHGPNHPIANATSCGAMSAMSSPSKDTLSSWLLQVSLGPHRGAQHSGLTAGSRFAFSLAQ